MRSRPTSTTSSISAASSRRTAIPPGFALGNAVGDANGYANWLLWTHGAYIVEEDGKVAFNRR